MKIQKSRSIADLVNENFKTTSVFETYGIDYCCSGEMSIEVAAQQANVNYGNLEKALISLDNSLSGNPGFDCWALDRLIVYMVDVHHSYMKSKIPQLIRYASKVVQAHRAAHPELIQIQRLYAETAIILRRNIEQEQSLFYSFARKIAASNTRGIGPYPGETGWSTNVIADLMEAHKDSGSVFKRIKALSNHFSPPPGASNMYRRFYASLEEFERNLHQYVHVEINILFPKVIQWEKQFGCRIA